MRKKISHVDPVLLWLTLGLLAFGLLMLSSASSIISLQRFDNGHYYFLRQLMFGAVPGLVLMYILSRVDYHIWQKFSPLLILIGIGLLVAVLIPGIGLKVGGARRWVDFGAFLFQPAEFVKLAMIFYLASWYDKRGEKLDDFYYGFLPSLAIVGIVSGLIILEPDMGTMLVLVAIAATMFFIGGVKKRYLAYTGAAGVFILWIMVQAAPYRANRFFAYFNPQADAQGVSYQINQALLAIGSGGMWGLGFGNSQQKHNYLPEPIGDSIFAIISEELGFVRVSLVLLAFILFAYMGYRTAVKAPDTFGKLVAAGITTWVVMQAFINIGGITAILPLTGIPLPFISYGSTALAMNLAGIGVLLNISRFRTR